MEIVYKLIEVAGLGGFCAFMIWSFGRKYMKQQSETIKALATTYKEHEDQLIDLMNNQAEIMVSTSVALQRMNDLIERRAFCPYRDNKDESIGDSNG